MNKNYERYNRWRKKHRRQHNNNMRHYKRIKNGFYDGLENKIKYYEDQLARHLDGTLQIGLSNFYIRLQRGYYRRLPAKIKKLERILKSYKKGEIPNE